MMRPASLHNFRLRYLPFSVLAVLVALSFAGPASAVQSCSFVYHNSSVQSGSPSTAATTEAACKLTNWSTVNSIGDTITDTFHLGVLKIGDPRTNNANYDCPGRQLVTPSDPAHCQFYPGGAPQACGTGYGVTGVEI